MNDSTYLNPEKNKRLILIIEDDEPDQVLVQRKVRDLWPDCVIIPVKSLQDAYREHKKNNFDMVLLDLNLPDGFGPSSVQEVRRFNKTVPIIVITGSDTDLAVNESLKKGANNVVLKSQIMNDDFFNVLEQNVEIG